MIPLSTLLNHPKLPTEIRDEILAEMEAQNKDIANEEFVSVYDLIWGAFTWGKSKMGYEYWIGMADNCKALGI